MSTKEIDKERFIERTEYKFFGLLFFEKIRYLDSSCYVDDVDKLLFENKVFKS